MRRTRAALVGMLAAGALVASALPAQAASTFTQNSFSAGVSGTSGVLAAKITATPAVTVNDAKFCTYNSAGALVDYTAPASKAIGSATSLSRTTAALAAGTYTSTPCVREGSTGSYIRVGSSKSFTIGSAAPQPTGVTGSWSLGFDDEFSGTALDTSKWAPHWFTEGGVQSNVPTYAKNITVSGGIATLVLSGTSSAPTGASMTTASQAGGGGYTLPVGGFLEYRAFFPVKADGTSCANWGSVWATSIGAAWPAGGEHDLGEVLGGAGLSIGNYHYADSAGTHVTDNDPSVSPGVCGSWHVLGLSREATSSKFYLDGALSRTVTTHDDGTPEALVVDNGGKDNPTSDIFGTAGALKVDYARAWIPA